MEYVDMSFEWEGYSTIRVATPDGTVVYLDPGRTDYGVLIDKAPNDADYVLVSHSHHYDPHAIHRVGRRDTKVYVLEYATRLEDLASREPRELIPPLQLEYDVTVFEYGESFEIGEIAVQTVPAYNRGTPEGLNIKANGEPNQPPGTCVGIHLTVDDTNLFWPSDSDVIEEHKDLDVDVLFAPISQVVTMNRLEAIELVEMLEPDLTIPVHYRWQDKTPDGGNLLIADPNAFRDDVEGLGFRCEII